MDRSTPKSVPLVTLEAWQRHSYGKVTILDDNGTDWRTKEPFRALAATYGQADRAERTEW